MIRQLLAKLSNRLHRIDEIGDRQAVLLTELATLRADVALLHTALVQSQAQREAQQAANMSELRSLLASLTPQLETLLQAELDSRGHVLHTQMTSRGELLGAIEQTRFALGRIESRQTEALPPTHWEAMGFGVTSQFGEDGFLQHLVRQLPQIPRSFVEFGVEDYRQANTRFLLEKDRWRGLVLDGSERNIATLCEGDAAYWMRDLTAVAAFVTCENINTLLTESGFAGELGLLSIDIDGNDFWVWQAIDAVMPQLVSVEYNFRFGPDVAATVPYDPTFDKNTAHPSRLYYGASLHALTGLADARGYDLVGCSDGGVNAFFVRRDVRPETLPRRTVAEAFRVGQHGEWHDPQQGKTVAKVIRASYQEQHALLMSLPLERFEHWEAPQTHF